MKNIYVPKNVFSLTGRKIITQEWIEGTKLADQEPEEILRLINLAMDCYMMQLLETGFLHADPHPGNLIRKEDGTLAILDFGLMEQVNDNDREGMLNAIIHLANRDYRNIIQDFAALGFLPKDIQGEQYQDQFAKAFDDVLTRGAKNVAFSDVTKGLIAATLDLPFGLPEYFALILRMVGTLEGIAVQADENWIFVDAAFPFVLKKMIMEESSKDILQEMIVDNNGKLSLSRISLLLESFDSFTEKNVRSLENGAMNS